MNAIKGLHHITAMTSSAEEIYKFFTDILGLRLVKKTINQDDIHTYHLFFADDIGSPGTDMTFFDFKHSAKGVKGSNEISRIGFRVKNDLGIDYWMKRFDHYQISFERKNLFNRDMLFFEDFDGQEYAVVSDENLDGVEAGVPWKNGPVPDEFALVGLGPVFIRVNDQERMDKVMTQYLQFNKQTVENNYTLYDVGKGGNGGSVIVENTPSLKPAMLGDGSIHHMAFRIDNIEALNAWIQRLNGIGARHSGHVNRFYFHSLYTRLYPNILFEFATEGPGFIDDEEDYEHLGETLALPPKFRNSRKEIEQMVRHIDTSRKTYKKEYFDSE